jgi:scyllo-inositol 2-dehydrogenase (NADP+)
MNSKDSSINVALAAYGMSGTVFHAPLIASHSGLHLKKVLERSGSQRTKEKYPYVNVVNDYGKILDDKEIELVVVNTPEHTHYELSKRALLAGKNVIVEKAFTTTSKEAKNLIDLAKKNGKVLSVFQNSRFHGDFLTVRKVIENKLVGKLVEMEVHYDRFRNFIRENSWKEDAETGAGTLYNLGSHMIDQVLVLFGMPKSLYGDIRIQRPGGKIDDNFEVIMNYDDIKVSLKTSYLVREQGPRYILHGTEGSFVKYGADPQEAFLKAGKSPLLPEYGIEPEEQWGKLNSQLDGLHFEGKIETLKGSYLDYYNNIYDAIRKNKDLLVKPEEAMRTIQVIEAAKRSSEEKKVVSFDIRS